MNSKLFLVLAVAVLAAAWVAPSFAQNETKTDAQTQQRQVQQQPRQEATAVSDAWKSASWRKIPKEKSTVEYVLGSYRPYYPSAPCMDLGYSYGLSCSYLYDPQWSGRWLY